MLRCSRTTRAKHGGQLATWVEVLTGLVLHERGSANVLDGAAWLQCREKLKQLGSPPVAGPDR
jgi:hypothetical protein